MSARKLERLFCFTRTSLRSPSTGRKFSTTSLSGAEAVSLLPWRRRETKSEEAVGVATTTPPQRREKFIPVTRRSLMRRLREEEGLLNWEERDKLETFAAALNAHFSHRFLATLQEAKVSLQGTLPLSGGVCQPQPPSWSNTETY